MSRTVTTKPCMFCQARSEVVLEEGEFEKYMNGMFVQEALSSRSSGVRELVLTGTHPACWDAVFPAEEEEGGWELPS